MKAVLTQLISGGTLDEQQAHNCLVRIGEGEISDEQIVSFMTILQLRGLQLEELAGFRNALMELALPIKLEANETIDVCGTGGDGKDTFNISTTTAFVIASMGYKVVKHGNYGVSSLCGSSTVLEELGIVFSNREEDLQRQLDATNICFLHAPLFHPALKRVAPLRKALGVPTFFNGIGPLVNPANPTHQLTGTYSLELAKKYRHVLKDKRTSFTILHGMDGFDELTFIGKTRILGRHRDELISESPFKTAVTLTDLSGGKTAHESAQLLIRILKGNGDEAHNTVIAGNVALALQTFHPEMEFEHAFHTAHEQVLSGKAFQHLVKLTLN